jgi:glutamate racemase
LASPRAAPGSPGPAAPIGVFDSGVGGLTVARALRDALPAERLVYFGDTARVPYGDKSARTVTAYSLEIAAALVGSGVKALVVACNTASALAVAAIRRAYPDLPVRGVVGPGARAAVSASPEGSIGVVGTRATIASRAYERAILDLAPSAQVHAAPCPLFVPLVEERWFDHPVTRLVIAEYLDPLLARGIDTLLLGCTHYPFLAPAIRSHAGPGVTVVDSATACAHAVREMLFDLRILAPQAGGGTASSRPPAIEVRLTDAPDRFLAIANEHLGLGIDPASIQVVPPDRLGAVGAEA